MSVATTATATIGLLKGEAFSPLVSDSLFRVLAAFMLTIGFVFAAMFLT